MKRKINTPGRAARAAAAWWCACAVSMAACGYLSITARDDMSEGRVCNSAVVMGRVEGPGRCAVMVAAWGAGQGATPAESVVIDRPGPFMLYLPRGSYRLFALCDGNGDGAFDAGEACGAIASEIPLDEGEVRPDVVIEARPGGDGVPALPGRARLKDDAEIPRQPGNGDRARIYDERFSPHNAGIGWWSPSLFMKGFGARIHFIHEYDPRKIPVLFVHGAQGGPQDWAGFHFRLDGRRYQPWYYYYPTGIRLPLASRLLYEDLREIRRKHGFRALCIAAHSMGGLVTRDMLARHDLRGMGIEKVLYVTLAPPWSGFRSADRAMALPSRRLPIWTDVGTSSDFIARTLRAKLPGEVRHYLFFGREDGVAAGRALDERARGDAIGTYGFDAGHDTILTDRKVFDRFDQILKKELR